MLENQEDLKVHRSLVTKLKATDKENPRVVEINFALFAIPKKTRTDIEYQASIAKILKNVEKACRKYMRDNNALFKDKIITEYSFTPTNLKKGYNKYVTLSMYLRQQNNYSLDKIRKEIKKTIKVVAESIIESLHNEGFNSYKTKQKQG